MITCKQSTEWVVKAESEALTSRKVMLLKAHLDDCPYCRLFAEQSSLITKVFQNSKAYNRTYLSGHEKRSLEKVIEIKIKDI